MKYSSILAALLLTVGYPKLTSAIEPKEIRIGTLTGLSGYSATQGTDCRNAIEATAKSYADSLLKKGYSLKVISGDSQGAARPALSEFSRLVNVENVMGIALDRSPVGMAVNPFSQRQAIPIFGVVGHHKFIAENEYAFRVWPATAREGEALAKKVIADGVKELAIVTSEDDWLLSLKEAFVKALEGSEVKVIYNENINPTETDFSTQITKIRHLKPNAIFLNLVIGQPGVALKKIDELGLQAQVYANYFAGRQDELDIAKETAEGMILADIDYDATALGELFTRYGYPKTSTNSASFCCYNAMNYITKALLSSESPINNSADLQKAALAVDSIDSLGKTIAIKDRELQFSFVYHQIINGKAADIPL